MCAVLYIHACTTLLANMQAFVIKHWCLFSSKFFLQNLQQFQLEAMLQVL